MDVFLERADGQIVEDVGVLKGILSLKEGEVLTVIQDVGPELDGIGTRARGAVVEVNGAIDFIRLFETHGPTFFIEEPSPSVLPVSAEDVLRPITNWIERGRAPEGLQPWIIGV